MKNRTGKIIITFLVMIAMLFAYRPEQAKASITADPYDYYDSHGSYTYVSREKAEQMMFSMADGTYPWCTEKIIYEGSAIFPYKPGEGTTYFEQQLVSSYRKAVNNDYYIFNTEVTGYDGKAYTATMMGPSGYIYNGNNNFTLEEFIEADNELTAVAASLNSGSTYERLKKILDWVCDRYEYGEDEGGAAYMNICTSLRSNLAVCREYAETVQLLADKMGLECYIWLPEDLAHALNIVFLDGQYYFLDATFYDTTSGVSGFFEGLDNPHAYEKYDADDVAAHGITIAATSYQTSDRKTDTTPVNTETGSSNSNSVIVIETEQATASHTEYIPPQTSVQETEAYENEVIHITGAVIDVYPEYTEAAEDAENMTVPETEEESEAEAGTEIETTKSEKETVKSPKETVTATEAETQTDTAVSLTDDTDNTSGKTGKKPYVGFIIAGVILLAGVGTAVVLTVKKRRAADESDSE